MSENVDLASTAAFPCGQEAVGNVTFLGKTYFSRNKHTHPKQKIEEQCGSHGKMLLNKSDTKLKDGRDVWFGLLQQRLIDAGHVVRQKNPSVAYLLA